MASERVMDFYSSWRELKNGRPCSRAGVTGSHSLQQAIHMPEKGDAVTTEVGRQDVLAIGGEGDGMWVRGLLILGMRTAAKVLKDTGNSTHRTIAV
jgi:hypothetical protein